MTFDDIRKKLENVREGSKRKHYKVSIGELIDAVVSLLEYIEETKKEVIKSRPQRRSEPLFKDTEKE